MMALEKQIKSLRSKLKVKETGIEDRISFLSNIVKSDINPSLIKFHDQQLVSLLEEYNVVSEQFQILLLENVKTESDVDTTMSELRKTLINLQEAVYTCRSSLMKMFDSSDSNANNYVKSAVNLKMPELQIPTFSDNSSNVFAFESFRSSFLNALSSVPSLTNIEKMVYLKSALRGQALSLVDNLNIDDTCFEQAWKLLESEYYDKEYIVDYVLSEILNYSCCTDVDQVFAFNTFLKSFLLNLNKLGYDFENKTNSSGNLLMSKIIRTKLPKFFLQELTRKSGESYPSVDQFINYASEICKMHKRPDSISGNKINSSISHPKVRVNNSEFRKHNDIQTSVKMCKFCAKSNHSSSNCTKYNNYNDRVRRAGELGLCTLCLGKFHKSDNCPGKLGKLAFPCAACKQNNHVTPLCRNMVMSLSSAKKSNGRD